jgi:hypothetical protein
MSSAEVGVGKPSLLLEIKKAHWKSDENEPPDKNNIASSPAPSRQWPWKREAGRKKLL